jgi:5-methylphenazine-1-carboxylate 1-monooxygenase
MASAGRSAEQQNWDRGVLQLVEERIRGPEDDIASVITREELDEIARRYRRIAGFDVETLNRKPGQAQNQRKPAA